MVMIRKEKKKKENLFNENH